MPAPCAGMRVVPRKDAPFVPRLRGGRAFFAWRAMKMGVNLIRDYQEADWPRLQAIHDAARLDELRLAGLEGAEHPLALYHALMLI